MEQFCKQGVILKHLAAHNILVFDFHATNRRYVMVKVLSPPGCVVVDPGALMHKSRRSPINHQISAVSDDLARSSTLQLTFLRFLFYCVVQVADYGLSEATISTVGEGDDAVNGKAQIHSSSSGKPIRYQFNSCAVAAYLALHCLTLTITIHDCIPCLPPETQSLFRLRRWMAPESIASRRYSSKSDVFSFGTLLWEIWSHGAIPFHLIADDDEVGRRIILGERPERPANCPDSVQRMMESCWKNLATDRPTFAEIQGDIEEATSNIKRDILRRAVADKNPLADVKCLSCLERAATVQLLPCSHLCSCAECADLLDECPMCSATVESRTTIH